VNKSKKPVPPEPTKPTNPPNLPTTDEQWDAFFRGLDHDEDTEAPDSSMISFVMKNLRPGTDLSRMPLPTWFLQKRSILESYSDFFRHADEFVRIGKESTAEARMVQCFRWFMVGFNDHFFKLTKIAKKPFNSVIGETFTAEFKIDENTRDLNENSPWPWMSSRNLIFAAEQVSHHPPISAFYVECPNGRISASCYIQAVAKFRGLAIKVKNLGSLSIKLLNVGEEYVISYPLGFGRSLLTTPWVEAGGHGTISCAQSKYSLDIEFFTKSLFSSETNKIKATLSHPSVPPKNSAHFEGHWDKQIFKVLSGKNSLLVDMSQLRPCPFVERPFSSLPDNESRKVWRDVAWCIKNKNPDKANEFKAFIENTQRREQALRDDRDIQWTPRLFRCHPNSDSKKKDELDPWEFINPLPKNGRAKPVTLKAAERQLTEQPQLQTPVLVEAPSGAETSSNEDQISDVVVEEKLREDGTFPTEAENRIELTNGRGANGGGTEERQELIQVGEGADDMDGGGVIELGQNDEDGLGGPNESNETDDEGRLPENHFLETNEMENMREVTGEEEEVKVIESGGSKEDVREEGLTSHDNGVAEPQETLV